MRLRFLTSPRVRGEVVLRAERQRSEANRVRGRGRKSLPCPHAPSPGFHRSATLRSESDLSPHAGRGGACGTFARNTHRRGGRALQRPAGDPRSRVRGVGEAPPRRGAKRQRREQRRRRKLRVMNWLRAATCSIPPLQGEGGRRSRPGGAATHHIPTRRAVRATLPLRGRDCGEVLR